jgi:hypothetical protein
MKRFLLLMLCLSGLLACSKDKTEDVPPVPPGSEEIPDKLELKAGDTDFNSLAYTVTAGKDGNEYLHVVYDKSFYDGVVGVFYQPADLLQKDGKRGTGTQSYTVKNGDAYPDGTTIFILGKADYVILAAVCDEKGVIKGEITSVETASVFRLWAEVKSSLLSTLRASTSPAVERYSCILLLKLPMSFTRSNIVSYPYLPATASRLELLSLNIDPP